MQQGEIVFDYDALGAGFDQVGLIDLLRSPRRLFYSVKVNRSSRVWICMRLVLP
jgi:hypothetical protein